MTGFRRVKVLSFSHSIAHMCFFPFSSGVCFPFSTVCVCFSSLKSAWMSSMAFWMCWPKRYESCRKAARGLSGNRNRMWMDDYANVAVPCEGRRTCWRCGMWSGFLQQLCKTRRSHRQPPGNGKEWPKKIVRITEKAGCWDYNSLDQILHPHPHI